jgi:hypothetical protein
MTLAMQTRMRFIVALIGLACFTSATALADEIRGDGNFIDQTRTVPAFHVIDVESGIQVEVHVGAKAKVEIRAEDNILPLVETEVSGETLHIRFAEGTHSDAGVNIRVTVPSLTRIKADGGARVSGEIAKVDSLKLEASGGAEVRLQGLEVKSLQANGSSAATLDLAGRADELALKATGATRFPLENLAVRAVQISASGACRGAIQASELVTGSITGASSLNITGGAKAQVASTGASSLEVN